MNYYDEVIARIEKDLKEGSLEDAVFLLRQELSMPYIPQEVETKLHQLRKEAAGLQAAQREAGEQPLAELLEMLQGSPEQQLQAAGKLTERNLRECTEEIRAFLAHHPQRQAASLLIDALGQQEVPEEFTYVQDGVEYVFAGDAVVPVARSAGFLKAMELLEKMLAKNPGALQLARGILIQRAYALLPLSMEEEEGEEAALAAVKEVAESLQDPGLAAQAAARLNF
jgi:hypothetical protein